MSADPIRDQLAANPPTIRCAYCRGTHATMTALEACAAVQQARADEDLAAGRSDGMQEIRDAAFGDLGLGAATLPKSEETPAEDIRNGMMLLQNGVRNLGAHSLCLDRADYAAIWSRLEKAVRKLEAGATPQ